MSLTDAQYSTLANHIRNNTDQAVIDALAIRNDTELARLYNLDASPDFYVWRTSIEPEEYKKALVWSQVDQLNTGKARIWEWVTSSMTLAIDASDSNVRQGIADAFSGATLSNLNALAKRLASVFEEVFATGTGSQGDPAVMGAEGPVTINHIGKALNEF